MKRWLCVVAVVILAGCTSMPSLSPAQRRAMQTRSFEKTNYDDIFRAFKTVLQDEGYIIKNQDLQGGLIVANIQKTDKSGAFWAAMGGQQNYRTGEGFELSVNFEKVNPTLVESRMTLQKLEQFSMGGQQGQEILDAELYRGFYEKVKLEVERRKAKG